MDECATRVFDGAELRRVFGHYPTGVTAVTAVTPDNKPLGLTIGTFTSVSLDPPLIAFYPQITSSTFARLRSADHFCVNILAEDQEATCRQLSSGGEDRMSGIAWHPSPHGAPVLDEAIAWVECGFDSVEQVGDHYVVIGRVTALATMRDRLPLLFFQGGYGSFTPRSLTMPASADMAHTLMAVDVARPHMEQLAARTELGCAAQTVVGNQIAVAASTRQPRSRSVPTTVGQRVPFVPPFGSLFVAWQGAEEIDEWLSRSTAQDEARLVDYRNLLARIRTRGWSIALSSDDQVAVERALTSLTWGRGDLTPNFHGLLDRAHATFEPATLPTDGMVSPRHIGAPVRDANGAVPLTLHLFGFAESITSQDLDAYVDDLLRVCAEVSNQLTVANFRG